MDLMTNWRDSKATPRILEWEILWGHAPTCSIKTPFTTPGNFLVSSTSLWRIVPSCLHWIGPTPLIFSIIISSNNSRRRAPHLLLSLEELFHFIIYKDQ